MLLLPALQLALAFEPFVALAQWAMFFQFVSSGWTFHLDAWLPTISGGHLEIGW